MFEGWASVLLKFHDQSCKDPWQWGCLQLRVIYFVKDDGSDI